ncbi:MAG TPA: hypothetical protein VMB72_14520 [Acidimicrobiales bacterium]|nr:hypothetical protein [Acidimicrobiales bacterium]
MTPPARPDRDDRDEAPDLDRLIGDVEAEGARHRAAPDFPHDGAAAVGAELDRQAPPPGPGAGLAAAMDEVDRAVTSLVAAVTDGPPAGAGRGRGRAGRARGERIEHLVAGAALALAGAARVMAAELGRQEGAQPGGPAAAAAPAAPAAPATVAGRAAAAWRERLAEHLPRQGRVLVAGAGQAGGPGPTTEALVAELRAGGVDAYGVTSAPPLLQAGPDVRHGALLEHLRAVGRGGLGAAVVTDVPDALTPELFAALVPELARCAPVVVAVSVAPWWWRRTLGAVAADTAPGRPFEPDTWVEALTAQGLVATAAYDEGGRSFRVVASTGPAS